MSAAGRERPPLDPRDVLEGKKPPPKVPLWASIGAAYGAWFAHFGLLLRIAGPWVAITLLPTAAIMWMVAPDQIEVLAALDGRRPPALAHPFAQVVWNGLSQLILLPAVSSIAVAWHRRLLLDETPPPGLYLRLDRVVTGYGVTALVIGFMMYVPGWIMVSAQNVLGTASLYGAIAFVVGLAGLVIMVIMSRLSLALPAKALARPEAAFGWAWRMTRGNTARLFFGYVACLFVPSLCSISSIALCSHPTSAAPPTPPSSH